MSKHAKTLFFLGLIVSSSGYVSPPVALTAGIVFGLTLAHPYLGDSRSLSKVLLQGSVVALGFGMNLQEVLRAGRSGFIYTALGISAALAAGWGLGRVLRVPRTPAFLISSGTAICGGSAIAAVAPILQAEAGEMSVALGTVFILNSVALLIFPPIGAAFRMTQEQFGLWAALAIHDTSSVVGAAAKYGAAALVIATTVKLARALWIVPLSLGTAAVRKSSTRVQIPWFIFLFCLAAVVNTYLPGIGAATHALSQLGKLGLTATLFLIGTGISRQALREVGWRPLLQGVLLWLFVGVGSLALIRAGLIGFAH
ncbi:MAG TPA: putative sulfate exporter family transporter [Candidatus Binatia bacterium]|nr:putative sulfate exporter family transporter [Candidatus Binatia bacterium]